MSVAITISFALATTSPAAFVSDFEDQTLGVFSSVGSVEIGTSFQPFAVPTAYDSHAPEGQYLLTLENREGISGTEAETMLGLADEALDATQVSMIWTEVDVNGGDQISFQHVQRTNNGSGDPFVDNDRSYFYGDGKLFEIGNSYPDSYSIDTAAVFDSFNYKFTLLGTQKIAFLVVEQREPDLPPFEEWTFEDFQSQGDGDRYESFLLLDDIRLVPEPTTAALFSMLIFGRRKRSRWQ